LTGSGSGTATASAVIENVYISLPGRWTTSDSILSTSERKLQGRNYYVDYAYVTASTTEFTKYKKVLKQLLHPAGFVNYADLNKDTSFTANTITISTTSSNTIAGTVNVGNNSIYVIGSNTKFNVANSLGIMTVGSYITVNSEIRVVSSIISNTNLAVTSAFTITANNEELLDLYKDKKNWAGCFGVMSFIYYNALEEIQEKYNFLNLLEIVKTRDDRMCVERIFAVISYKINYKLFHNPKPSLFGDIHRDYLSNWNFDYIKYLKIFYLSDTVCEPYNNYYAMKVWSGR
jgi:hypothetical protein